MRRNHLGMVLLQQSVVDDAPETFAFLRELTKYDLTGGGLQNDIHEKKDDVLPYNFIDVS